MPPPTIATSTLSFQRVAAGTGGSTPLAKTTDGVTEIFASNVLGHVVLLEELIEHALPYQLNALTCLEFTREGVRCTVELPLERIQ